MFSYADDLVGGSQASGFIERMMADQKVAYDGEYQTPPRRYDDSTMKAFAKFDFSRMMHPSPWIRMVYGPEQGNVVFAPGDVDAFLERPAGPRGRRRPTVEVPEQFRAPAPPPVGRVRQAVAAIERREDRDYVPPALQQEWREYLAELSAKERNAANSRLRYYNGQAKPKKLDLPQAEAIRRAMRKE